MSNSVTDISLLMEEVRSELVEARIRYGPFHTDHEAYGVLLEEVDEFWDEVKKKPGDRNPHKMRRELVQVAAMACRSILDLSLEPALGERERKDKL